MKPEATPHQYSPRQKRMKAGNAEHRSDQSDEVRSEPRARRPARQVECRLAPQVQRERVGDSFVRRVISGAFDGFGVGWIEREHERALAFPQLVIAELGCPGVECVVARDRLTGVQRPDDFRRVVAGGNVRHHRFPAESQHGARPCSHRLQPRRVPRVSHAREQCRAARKGVIGAFQSGVRREPERAFAGVHAEGSRSVRAHRDKQDRRVARHVTRINARNAAGKWPSGLLLARLRHFAH